MENQLNQTNLSPVPVTNEKIYSEFDYIEAQFNAMRSIPISKIQIYDGSVFANSCTTSNVSMFLGANANDIFEIRKQVPGKVLFRSPEDGKPLIFVCVRPANPKDFRGILRFTPPDTFSVEVGYSAGDSKRFDSLKIPMRQNSNIVSLIDTTDDNQFAERMGLAWEIIGPYKAKLKGIKKQFSGYVQIAVSILFDDYFSWKVYTKLKDWPIGIEIPFNRSNIKQVFKLRDLPNGALRRKALKTIISEHYRHKPNSDDLTEVLRHFRGSESFTVDGDAFRIIPSMEDCLEMQRLKLSKGGD